MLLSVVMMSSDHSASYEGVGGEVINFSASHWRDDVISSITRAGNPGVVILSHSFTEPPYILLPGKTRGHLRISTVLTPPPEPGKRRAHLMASPSMV